MNCNAKRKRVLAISSGGGHWIQLLRVRPAFEGHQITYASVGRAHSQCVSPCRYFSIPDANRSNKVGLLWLLIRMIAVFCLVRPHVVITTGAAPGYFAVRLGRLFGAKTLFLDSIANAETPSLSAQLSRAHADVVLVQWEDLASQHEARYEGSVL